ncbi:hypothetical protein COCSUDRAFT_33090 [Coccomyxa subellipsoidea C-169]|uniref:Uncharacterized protein n=1 Tax=Coccomyxa subellipsoidea (strain C-169) TaxID=574566 RepID=I0YYN1_COCSC|nr:hypothetical protein COCSUDRAFT_33090 [Coccomyxa subellipsoidea C-169]EIE23500.1 hypothetical protein COCSUDRAFT_33090 [Coccomyxa subellipsoidea C-169]|eukprot:XP_005648044.1 hypothetical protein COCSUDRAFT_33090 [Coccomyxa subellipsoidea C-169]
MRGNPMITKTERGGIGCMRANDGGLTTHKSVSIVALLFVSILLFSCQLITRW